MSEARSFAAKLIAWQRRHGRHDLPWQGTRDPYRIWLSEVMLQQTQVAVVIPYYERFLRRFPDVRALARSSEEEVLRLWSGLGYYARGRNLHKAASEIHQHGFPRTAEKIAELPGIGRSTAAAIAAFAYGEHGAILDGNVKRVLARCFGRTDERSMWRKAEALLPRKNIETYTQALMDLGATVCSRVNPRCDACPVSGSCLARRQGRIAEWPAPRKARLIPERSVSWHVLRHNGEVLLERRPSPGIWGGLWCFPETLERKPSSPGRRLAPIEHGFTHFRLRIRPRVYDAKRRRAQRAESCWMTLAEAEKAAVPAPVRTLLARLRAARG